VINENENNSLQSQSNQQYENLTIFTYSGLYNASTGMTTPRSPPMYSDLLMSGSEELKKMWLASR